MVYCGKPSKGCSHCRERKIRCDQREPSCGQCLKRQQECPGYRNMVDLMFRDESSHVIKKAKAKARKKGIVFTDNFSDSSPEADFRTFSVTPEPLSSTSSGSTSATGTTTATTFAPSVISNSPSNNSNITRSSSARDRVRATANNPRRRLSLITPNTSSFVTGATLPGNFTRDPQTMKWGPPDDGGLPSPDSGNWPTTPMIALLYNLNPACQEQGTAYFFSRYVNREENICHQRFDFVGEVWKPETLAPERQVDVVLASMTAVGLMGLANMTRSTDMTEAARKSYGTALRLTNRALESPTEAVKDTTMLSVLVLGLFEMQHSHTHHGIHGSETDARRTVHAFQEHVNGATALAKMRGPAQFATRAGVRMFSMLCQRVILSCIQNDLPMPAALVDLHQELVAGKRAAAAAEAEADPTASPLTDDAIQGPSMSLFAPVCDLLQARCDMRNGVLTDPTAIVERLLAIEAAFARVAAHAPASWRYRTFRVNTTQNHPAIFRGLFHMYASTWHATQWNCVRTLRVLVLETILSTFGRAPQMLAEARWAEEFVAARRTLERVLGAISASVPQNLGLVGPRGDDAADGGRGYRHRHAHGGRSDDEGDHSSSGNVDELTPASTPISSFEVRETPSPSPAASPDGAARVAVGAGGMGSAGYGRNMSINDIIMGDDNSNTTSVVDIAGNTLTSPHHQRQHLQLPDDHDAPNLLNPTRAISPDDRARRFMLLASSLHPIVWPLYLLGMSSAASEDLRGYAVDRLRSVATECSVEQADEVAGLLEQLHEEDLRRGGPGWMHAVVGMGEGMLGVAGDGERRRGENIPV